MSDYDQLAYKLRKPLAPYFPSFTADNLGTYVPTYIGGTTAGVTTYSTQQGSYMLIGPMCFFTCTVVWTNATGTGSAVFSLPFTPAATANQNYAISVRTVNVTFANGTPQGLIVPSSATFILQSPLTNAASTTVVVEVAGNVIASGFYFLE